MLRGVSFDQFWYNSEKRDAVALRISVLGESAYKIVKWTIFVRSAEMHQGWSTMPRV
jgi:uncharacterized protein with HEPN domain